MPKNLNFNINAGWGVIIFILVIIVGAVYLSGAKNSLFGGVKPSVASNASKYDDFAKCLTEKGAKMYGAFWCGHCQNLKAAFGSSFQYVNYQECTVDGQQNSFAQVCKDAGIQGFPTWKFSDGSAMTEKLELIFSKLSEKTGCVLPK